MVDASCSSDPGHLKEETLLLGNKKRIEYRYYCCRCIVLFEIQVRRGFGMDGTY